MSRHILTIISTNSHQLKIEIEEELVKAPIILPITKAIVKSTIMRLAIAAEAEEVMGVTESAQAAYQHGSMQLATKNIARDKNSNNSNSNNNLILSMNQLLKRHHHKARKRTKQRISPVKKGVKLKQPMTTPDTMRASQPLEERQ